MLGRQLEEILFERIKVCFTWIGSANKVAVLNALESLLNADIDLADLEQWKLFDVHSLDKWVLAQDFLVQHNSGFKMLIELLRNPEYDVVINNLEVRKSVRQFIKNAISDLAATRLLENHTSHPINKMVNYALVGLTPIGLSSGRDLLFLEQYWNRIASVSQKVGAFLSSSTTFWAKSHVQKGSEQKPVDTTPTNSRAP